MNMNPMLRFALGFANLSETTLAHIDQEFPALGRLASAMKEAEPELTAMKPDIEAIWPHLMLLLPHIQKLWPIAVKAWPDLVEITPTAQEIIDMVMVRHT